MTKLLEIVDLSVRYNAVPAVSDVSIEVPAGEIRVILGANGAGKLTIIKAILDCNARARGRSVSPANMTYTGCGRTRFISLASRGSRRDGSSGAR